MGSGLKDGEALRLSNLIDREGGVDDLRWALVEGLRSRAIALDTPGLKDYLRFKVINQVAIDQPNYSGFKTAIN